MQEGERSQKTSMGHKAVVRTGDYVALAGYLQLMRRPTGLIIPKGLSNKQTTFFTTACVIDWSTAVLKMSQALQMLWGSICLMYHRDAQQQQTRSQGQKKHQMLRQQPTGFYQFSRPLKISSHVLQLCCTSLEMSWVKAKQLPSPQFEKSPKYGNDK